MQSTFGPAQRDGCGGILLRCRAATRLLCIVMVGCIRGKSGALHMRWGSGNAVINKFNAI